MNTHCHSAHIMSRRSLIMDILVAMTVFWGWRAAHAAALDKDIQLVSEQPGWKRAWTHQQMEPLYNSSLYPDLAVFRARVRLPSALGIANQLRRYHANNTRVRRGSAVLVIRAGKVEPITWEDFNPVFEVRLNGVVSELQRHQNEGHIALEDSVFILNTRDVPLCSLGYCLVPLFSSVKEIRNGNAYTDDLLVPLMSYPHEQLVNYPVEKKFPKGALAAPTSEPSGDSSCRSVVKRFAADEWAGGYISVLDDATITKMGAWKTTTRHAAVSGMTASPPPPEPLSRFTLALSCDAQTASPGLAALLHTNSMVLKGRSFWYEYYYRALKDGVHYREFDPGEAIEVVKQYLKPESQEGVRQVVEEAQKFAYAYLSQRSRALFFEKAISEYNKLFGPGYMEATVADLPKRRLTMDDILAMRMYPSSWRQGLARRTGSLR